MAEPALELSEVSKDYGDVVALAPLDLVVPCGQMVALVGHNGSGKSTLLRLASGLLELSGGSISVVGAAVGTVEARAATSFIPDEPVLYDDLSVREHLAYISALHGAEVGDDGVDELIRRVGLEARADDLPARFSRGLRQKTSIAIGLVRPFELLLVDEPFVGLDAPGKASLLELLAEVHQEGAAVLVATHDAQVVERVERCIGLRDGEVVHDGPATPAEVVRLVGG